MRSFVAPAALIAALVLTAAPCTPARAAGPFTLIRSFDVGQSWAFPTFYDYNGDGVDDFVAGGKLLNGLTGATLATWTTPDATPLTVYAPLPDSTGDGKPEFLFGDSLYSSRVGAVFAVPSQPIGGTVPGANMLYQVPAPSSTGAFGEYLAVTPGPSPVALLGWSSAGNFLLVNPATGAIQARFSRSTASVNPGLSFIVGAVGDINGDGHQDFAIGDPNVNNGELYLLTASTTTPGTTYVPINTSGGVFATLHTTTGMILGAFGQSTIANLGDPTPVAGTRHQLLVVGTPYNNNDRGGFAAFLVSTTAGVTTSSQVASFTANAFANNFFGEDVVPLTDLDGDGVNDVAILSPGDGTVTHAAFILILSGQKLLDGYQPATDIIQTINDFYQFQHLSSLGDYDHNGTVDLLAWGGNPSGLKIYSAAPAPEPSSLSILLFATGLLTRRTRRR